MKEFECENSDIRFRKLDLNVEEEAEPARDYPRICVFTFLLLDFCILTDMLEKPEQNK